MNPQSTESNFETDSKREIDDVKMRSDGDEGLSSPERDDKKDDGMQMGDGEDINLKKEDASSQVGFAH